MPAYVDLQDGHRRLGRFVIPSKLTGVGGTSYSQINWFDRGGNGTVFEATCESIQGNPSCAIKVLRNQDAVRIDRFDNEVRIQQKLTHPRIAELLDHGRFSAGVHEVRWAAIQIGDSNFKRHVDEFGALKPDTLVATALDMCSALEHIHGHGIIHRDVKPANFVSSRLDKRPLMIDFGIAKYIGENVAERPLDQFTMHMEFVGPVFFSSPELIEYSRNKNHSVDYRSDLFQLAKVIWFLAVNRVSAGIPPKRLCPFGGRLHAVVCACLNEEPSDRPGSVSEFASSLKGLL